MIVEEVEKISGKRRSKQKRGTWKKGELNSDKERAVIKTFSFLFEPRERSLFSAGKVAVGQGESEQRA